MLAVAAAVTWHANPHAGFAALLVDVQSVGDRAIGEDRSALILAALQEYAVELVGTLSRLQREQLTTALMDVYNTGHSVYLRCAVLNALTALACEELFVSQQSKPLGSPASLTSPRSQTIGSVGSQTQHGLLDQSHQAAAANNAMQQQQAPAIVMWITELYYLLHAAASASTSHRHLKQSVLSADTLNATALQCLDELHIAMPTLRAQLGQQRSRTRQQSSSGHQRQGDASAREPQPPTEALRSMMRIQRLFRLADAVHDSGAYVAAQPASRLYAAEVGVKRSLASAAQGRGGASAVVKAFHEAVGDVLDAIDSVPRPWLPQVIRIISVVWNYEGINTSLSSKLDRSVMGTLQAQRRSRRHNASGSPVVSGLNNQEASFLPGGSTSDLLSSTCMLCSAWVYAARCKALAPPSFLSKDVFVTDDGSISIPGGYVLRTGDEGLGLYWDDVAVGAPSGGASPDSVGVSPVFRWWLPQSTSLLVRVADNASMDPQARSMVLAYVQALPVNDRQESFPFLVQPLAASNSTGRHGPQFPLHVMWDTAETLLLRLQCAANASSVGLTPVDTQRIIQYLRHLRDKCWYLPAVRTVVALAVASLVTSAPESFVAPAALLLATCRSAAVLHTLEAVQVYDALKLRDPVQTTEAVDDPVRALFDTTSSAPAVEPASRHAPSTYAVLLSSVVHQILLNEPPSRIVASLPVLTHAFGYRDGILPNKAALLDQLAVRVPELPNSWYCGHHVVTCCRVFLVSEIDRHLGSTSPTSSTETVQMISTTLIILDVVLRHFSDLAVSQTAAMIQNVLQHLPLDAVGMLLDVSADDVQEVLTVCERPQESKCHDASGAVHVSLSIQEAPLVTDPSWRVRDSTIRIPWKAVWTASPPPNSSTAVADDGAQMVEPQPLVGGAFEFYHTDPTELFSPMKNGAQTRRRGASQLAAHSAGGTELTPVASVPVVLLNAGRSTATFDVFLDVDNCAALNLFAVYRSPSGIRVPVGEEASAVPVPFVHFIRDVACRTQCTAPLENLIAESMVQTNLKTTPDVVSLIVNTFQIGAAVTSVSPGNDASTVTEIHLRIVPDQHVLIQWDHPCDGGATPVLLRMLSTDTTCLVFVEQLLLEHIAEDEQD